MTESSLSKAIILIASGDIDNGRNLMLRYLQTDTGNDLAWYWLSKTYTDDRRIYCLQKAAEINPEKSYLDESHQNEAGKQTPSDTEEQPQTYGRIFKPDAFQIILFRLLRIHLGMLWFTLLITQTLFDFLGDSSFLYGPLLYLLIIVYLALKSSTSLYHIEISHNFVIGPYKTRNGWKRKKLMINDIDLSKAKVRSDLLGYYSLETKQGNKIYLYSFTREHYHEILNLIRQLQVS